MAGDTEHPPTPVLWPEPASCIVTVDRSVDPILHLDYDIEFEDTLVTGHEVEDSRRHQFIAFCRQFAAGQPPPRYVSVADLQRAVDTENELELDPLDPLATLETHPDWSACFTRINADDERFPITYEYADAGVDWDTSAVEPGVYQVAGYTWEPPRNIWRRAPFVVRVTDDASSPAAALGPLALPTSTLYGDETLRFTPCGEAPGGGSLRGLWALSSEAGDPAAWQVFDEQPIDDALPELSFSPPTEAHGHAVVLAAEVEAAGGIERAYSLGELVVFVPASSDEPDHGGDEPGAADDGDGDAATAGCRLSSPAPSSLLPFFALTVLALAKRRPRPGKQTT